MVTIGPFHIFQLKVSFKKGCCPESYVLNPNRFLDEF
jgi:hypothetical protein